MYLSGVILNICISSFEIISVTVSNIDLCTHWNATGGDALSNLNVIKISLACVRISIANRLGIYRYSCVAVNAGPSLMRDGDGT